MKRALLVQASAVDWLLGDPEWLPHPVRLMGRAIAAGERTLLKTEQLPSVKLAGGAVLAAGMVALSYGMTWLVVRAAHCAHPWLGTIVETWLAASCLASRNLRDEGASVLSALHDDDLPLARRRLARIVGRDTHDLAANEIHRALIETLAESTCDAIVAPLFYLAIGGAPLAMAFKAVSTMDSMIGHRSPPYLYFGRSAARLDDAANFVPARLSALGIVIAAALLPQTRAVQSARTWWRDGRKHASPNAGQPEAAMAGALRVRLGGMNHYSGETVVTPEMGGSFPAPSRPSARTALHLVVLTSLAATAAAVLLTGRRSRA